MEINSWSAFFCLYSTFFRMAPDKLILSAGGRSKPVLVFFCHAPTII